MLFTHDKNPYLSTVTDVFKNKLLNTFQNIGVGGWKSVARKLL